MNYRKILFFILSTLLQSMAFAQNTPFEYSRDSDLERRRDRQFNAMGFLQEGNARVGYDGRVYNNEDVFDSGLLVNIDTRLLNWCWRDGGRRPELVDNENRYAHHTDHCPERERTHMLLFPTELTIRVNMQTGEHNDTIDLQRVRVSALKFLLANENLSMQVASYFQRKIEQSSFSTEDIGFRGFELVDLGAHIERPAGEVGTVIIKATIGFRVGRISQLPAEIDEDFYTGQDIRAFHIEPRALLGLRVGQGVFFEIYGGMEQVIAQGLRVRDFYYGAQLRFFLFDNMAINFSLERSHNSSRFTRDDLSERAVVPNIANRDYRLYFGLEFRFNPAY